MNKQDQTVIVQFVDFGNKDKKKFNEIFELAADLQEYPFQAIQCRLVNIKMSLFKNPNGVWTKAANKTFKHLVQSMNHDILKIKVFGLNENEVMVKLFEQNHLGVSGSDIGELLADSGYAEKVDVQAPKKPNTQILYVPTRNSDYIAQRPTIESDSQYVSEMMYRSKISANNYLAIDEMSDMPKRSKLLTQYDDDAASTSFGSFITDEMSQDDENENESNFSGTIDIRGPHSPLEVSYFPMVNIGHTKKTRVERESINYVTLDDDPFNECSRLMIASEVTLNSPGDTMILRKTSLMPKLPGLASICCLLFAPTAEFRTNEKKTMFTGALCGLGSDSHSAVYPDNDIETTFDVNIDITDITAVKSSLSFWYSVCLF